MDFEISVDVDAPPERVWAVMSDIERWHEWTPSVRSIERPDAGPLMVGSRARIRQPKLLPAVWKISAIDAPREFAWVTRGPGILVTARHGVEATNSGSRATLSLRFSGILGPLIGKLTSGLNERYLAMEATGLKRRSEERRTR